MRRHRQDTTKIETANIALMQYNLKTILRPQNKIHFFRPGYESNQFKLSIKHLDGLLDEASIQKSLNAIPRITCPEALNPKDRLEDPIELTRNNPVSGLGKR